MLGRQTCAANLAGASMSWWESEVSRSLKGIDTSIAIAARDLNRRHSTRAGLNEATVDDSSDGQDVSISDEGQRNTTSRQNPQQRTERSTIASPAFGGFHS